MVGFGGKRTTTVEIEEAVEERFGASRQNIGEILRVNGMRSYDEHKLLLKNEGRSCQDEFYIEHM